MSTPILYRDWQPDDVILPLDTNVRFALKKVKILPLLVCWLIFSCSHGAHGETIESVSLVENFEGKYLDGVPQLDEAVNSAVEGKLKFGYSGGAGAIFCIGLRPRTHLYADYRPFLREKSRDARFYLKETLLLVSYEDKKIIFWRERGFTDQEKRLLLDFFGKSQPQ